MKKKALITSMALLLVAVICLGTSTYAWFTAANTGVTAKGMQVQAATASAYLQIVNADGNSANALGTEASAKNGAAASMLPITNTAVSGATVSWGVATSTDPNDAMVSLATTPVADPDTSYVLANRFTVKTLGANATNLVVSGVTVGNSAADSLAPSLRVLVVTANGAYLYNNGTASGEYLNGGTNLAATVNATGVSVDVYIFFDGTDASCKTANAASTQPYGDITVTFGATA